MGAWLPLRIVDRLDEEGHRPQSSGQDENACAHRNLSPRQTLSTLRSVVFQASLQRPARRTGLSPRASNV